MAEPTKDELVKDAANVGVPEPDKLTKTELEDALESRNPEALGPVIPHGLVAPPVKATGDPIKGKQGFVDIPKSGR